MLIDNMAESQKISIYLLQVQLCPSIKGRHNSNVHLQMNGLIKCDTAYDGILFSSKKE